jgi:predicted nucleotidyltransferase
LIAAGRGSSEGWGEGERMAMTLDQVRRHRTDIQRMAAKYGARDVRIFGSVARGAAGPASDVDVLVAFEPGRSLLDLVGLEQDLSELLGCKVDVVSEGGISPYLDDHILREAVAL